MSRVTKAMKANRKENTARRRRWVRGMRKSFRLQRHHRCKGGIGNCQWVGTTANRGLRKIPSSPRSPGQGGAKP